MAVGGADESKKYSKIMASTVVVVHVVCALKRPIKNFPSGQSTILT
jgi:hypothetical protein